MNPEVEVESVIDVINSATMPVKTVAEAKVTRQMKKDDLPAIVKKLMAITDEEIGDTAPSIIKGLSAATHRITSQYAEHCASALASINAEEV